MSTKTNIPTETAGSTCDGAKIQTPEGVQIQPYLLFEGVCEEALTFYRTALGAGEDVIMRYKEASEGSGMSSPAMENKVMHSSLRVGSTTILASDGRCDKPRGFQGFALSLTVRTVEGANRFFAALEKGGWVQMPLSTKFFSPRFGMIIDRFGVGSVDFMDTMKRLLDWVGARRLSKAVMAISFGLVVSARADIKSFFAPDVQVLAVTDLTPLGKTMAIPSREHPIYYEGINAGFKEWGRSMAGEKIPPNKAMQDMVVRALAKNGYLSADNKHVGSQILVMSWGTWYQGSSMVNPYTAMKFLGGDKVDMTGEVDGGLFSGQNSYELRRAIPLLSQSKLREIASGDLYIALIRAYDVASADRGKTSELWETRIACPASGLAIDQTLPTMIRLATPNIGRETAKPVWSSPEKNFHEDIEAGELRVLDDVDVDKAHVTDIKELLAPEKPTSKEK